MKPVFTLPPGTDFPTLFARGFHARYGTLPAEVRARAQILVNSSRAASLIEAALADNAPAQGPLPIIKAIPDLGANPFLAPDVPPGVPAQRRHLRLTRLVEGFLAAKISAGERIAPMGAAADLARALSELIDQFHDAGSDPSGLDDVTSDDLADTAARHWQDTLRFLDLIRKVWPGIRDAEEAGKVDSRARQRAVIHAEIARWNSAPPETPVIAAASTGSVGSTADLLVAIADLPAGAIVLPALEPRTDHDAWDMAGADHPMGPFRNVLNRLDLRPSDVTQWVERAPNPRRTLIAQAMRPAPVTDHWQDAAPKLKAGANDACTGLAILEAATPRHEAMAIATAVRAALEKPGRTVSIITPDAALARRISAALGRFGIKPDDIMGQPLALTPPGVLASLVLDVARGAGLVPIAALLQHPLVSAGIPRLQHRDLAREYERKVLRHTGLSAQGAVVPDWPDAPEGGTAWLDAICAALEPLQTALIGEASLSDLLAAHIRAMEALTTAPEKPPEIWNEEAGAAFRTFFDGLARNADAFGAGPVADYAALLSGMMRGETLRSRPKEPHARVALRGAREARLEEADLTILAGLNDGVWPAAPDAGPWLSRSMHEALGLPLPEREVGLSAHDFLCGATRPDVLMTRSLRADGAPTVASRWLIRLETLLTGIGAKDILHAVKDRGKAYADLADLASRPNTSVLRALRPAPIVPPEARPSRLSVTRIETLIRDAYAVYAYAVLRLRPLDPLGRPPDARERGTVLHAIMEAFTNATPDWPGDDTAHAVLMQITDDLLARQVPWPDLRRTWRARIGRFAPWFLEQESVRRRAARPVGSEVRGKMVLDLPAGPMVVSAVADRIDIQKDGRAVIIDYKTGAPPTEKQIDAGWNHQLHVQAAILAAGGFDPLPAEDVGAGVYIGLTGSGDGGKETLVDLDRTIIAQHMDRVRELLTSFDQGAPWVSQGRPQHMRFAGDYDHLARKGEWAGEDQ